MPRLASSSRYCCVSGTGYRGVRARPKGMYYAEIRDGGEHIGLGTYETAREAARAPRISRRCRTSLDRRNSAAAARRSAVCASPSRTARGEWAARFPEDVAAENEHFRRRRAEKATRRAAKKEDRARRRAEKATKRAFIEAQLAGPTTIGEDDPRWIDLFSSDPVGVPSMETDARELVPVSLHLTSSCHLK
ncbi:hypothetical protein QYE76_006500 [Lolium multiflorum]|uniref:AP2/ERF domain-containing protein n=1 Tax=Lolium multiflorum TaxID=4521 RepID=A0AAD8RVS0_LOLMU|nr:hypothetical protein QYE76_006500 [Lolium multiflorum]